MLGAGALGVLFGLFFAFLWLFSPAPVAETPLRRFAIAPPVSVAADVWGGGRYDNSLAISPNARHIAFVEAGGQGRLWVQDLDQQQPRAIEGTEGARSPFWSPDSTVIGFAADGEVKKVSVRGGLASLVCELPAVHFHGGTWSPDGEVIVFSSGPMTQPHSLYQVPARGGAPGLLLAPGDLDQASEGPGTYPAWSHFLPSEAGARVLVFTFGRADEQTMLVQDLETGQRELLGPGAFPFYSYSGHLLYQTSPTSNDLWALPFSLETLRPTGEAFPVSENSHYATVAADETLVYLDISGSSGQQQLVWVDRDGKKVEEIGQPKDQIRAAALSPDGRRVAVSVREGSNWDVWVWDLARGVRTRLSTAPEMDTRPVWSPGGGEVAFTSGQVGNQDIYLRQADGSGEEQAVAATSQNEVLSDWSRDGKYLLYRRTDPETGRDLWYLERGEDGSGWEPHPFLQEPSLQAAPKFSPNGRYVAYISDDSGQMEVYVQPFPEGGRKVTVSNSGGSQVRWSRDGKELFYVQGEKLMVVAVSTEGEFSAGLPTELFEHAGLRSSLNYPNYDVSLDGQRFILPEPVAYGETEAPQSTIRVVENWFAEFKGRQQD
ncbi:MAG: PD40 domain-containing protein [Armatimonadetes bacterium]|nr:PD40 domain-containing protein [Armatimonadota bacterium]